MNEHDLMWIKRARNFIRQISVILKAEGYSGISEQSDTLLYELNNIISDSESKSNDN